MNLQSLLEALVAGGGGSLLYPLLNQWAWFQMLSDMNKRWMTMALSAGIGCIAFVLASVVMRYQPAPVDWRSWIETVGNIILGIIIPSTGTYVVSQMWHTRKLSNVKPLMLPHRFQMSMMSPDDKV
jgi:hypothetical protein